MLAGEALALSRNVPALSLLASVGVGRAVSVMDAAGLRTVGREPDRYGLSLAIGGAEATPLEVAEAMATLARGGRHKPLRLLFDKEAAAEPGGFPILSSASCQATMRALADRERTGRLARESVGLEVAWKTGTSSGHRDAWCVAATPRRVVVVWMGEPGGRGMPQLSGVDAAAPLALRLMSLVDSGGEGFPRPTDLVPARPPQQRPTASLAIASPLDGDRVLVESDRCERDQRVLLKAAWPGESGRTVWWFVNGESIGSGRVGEGLWWTPSPGRHQVRVVSEDGRWAVATVTVERR